MNAKKKRFTETLLFQHPKHMFWCKTILKIINAPYFFYNPILKWQLWDIRFREFSVLNTVTWDLPALLCHSHCIESFLWALHPAARTSHAGIETFWGVPHFHLTSGESDRWALTIRWTESGKEPHHSRENSLQCSKTCVKRPLSKRPKIGFQAGRNSIIPVQTPCITVKPV